MCTYSYSKGIPRSIYLTNILTCLIGERSQVCSSVSFFSRTWLFGRVETDGISTLRTHLHEVLVDVSGLEHLPAVDELAPDWSESAILLLVALQFGADAGEVAPVGGEATRELKVSLLNNSLNLGEGKEGNQNTRNCVTGLYVWYMYV